MRGFYFNEKNRDNLYNDVSILLSDNIIESTIAEGWMEDLYNSDKYNTTMAVEKYAANVMLPKLKNSSLTKEQIVSKIESGIDKLNKKEITFDSISDKIRNINKIKKGNMELTLLEEAISLFNMVDSLIYIKENYINGANVTDFTISEPSVRKLLTIIESIKRIVRIKGPGSSENICVKDGIDRILYLYKSLNTIERRVDGLGICQGINIHEVDSMTCEDIQLMFVRLEEIMKSQSDYIIEYIISELKYINNLIIESGKLVTPVTESFLSTDDYSKAIFMFNNLMESIFLDESDKDMDINELIKLQTVTEALCEYESTMEASSRIITKGTDKVTRGIGTASAKASGMSSSQSKVGQLKRGARVIDDRASAAINKKLDDIMNVTRDAKREKLITGKNTVKLGKALKSAIALVAGSAASKVVMGPVLGTITTIITLLTRHALSKRTGTREKKRILLELETELRIVKEKIEDAKGDNAREQKYQLMRIQASLEKEITRIKHGLRYY